MSFNPDPNLIRWRIHLTAAPALVCQALATPAGRKRLAAQQPADRQLPALPAIRITEETTRADGLHYLLGIDYGHGNSAICEISAASEGGSTLTLSNIDVPAAQRPEVIASWITLLLALKAAVDGPDGAR